MKSRNFLLQVRAIKPCPGGHTCNLIANGRKVAFIAPGIFEWSSHSIKVDVLDYYAEANQIKASDPVVLEDGWTTKKPLYDTSDRQEKAEQAILKWINGCIKKQSLAKSIKDRCKSTVMTMLASGAIIDYCRPPRYIKDPYSYEQFTRTLSEGERVLNGLTIDELIDMI